MLGDPDGHNRQLLDLMTRRLARRDPVGRAEDVTALAAHRPVLDDLVDRPRGQQPTALALVTGLTAGLASRPTLAALGRTGRILAGRLGGVARRALGLALELRDALLLARHPRAQRLDLPDQPRVLRRELHQHAHHDLAALAIDPIGLRPIHTTRFDASRLCPPTN